MHKNEKKEREGGYMNISEIFKIVLTTIDVIMALICLFAASKDGDYKRMTVPIVFILVNAGGLWI